MLRALSSAAAAGLWAACFFSAQAHPIFSSGSIVNAAGFQPPELAGGSIARGSIFSVFGQAVGPRAAVQATQFPLPTSLGGVTVTVSQPGFPDIPVIPLYVSEGQINAILPSNAPLGDATLRVRYDDGDGNPSSLPVPIKVVESSVGLFTFNATGRGPAAAMNFVSEIEQPYNSTEHPAHPGQALILWATGLGGLPGGAVNGDRLRPLDAGAVADMQASAGLEVWFGGVRAERVFYAGRSPEFAALDQIGVEIPAQAPLGCYVPVWLKVRGGRVSNIVSVSIGADDGRCDDPLNPHLGPSIGERIGTALLSRVITSAGAGNDIQDTGAGAFERLILRRWHFNPAFSLPPLGTCMVYTERDGAGGVPNLAPAAPLDAGQLIVRGPRGSRFLTTPPGGSGRYGSLFSDTAGTYLEPGDYTLEGTGGPGVGVGVGAFSAGVRMPAAPTWSLQGDGFSVNRAAGLTVSWPAEDATETFVRILLISSNGPSSANNVTTTVFCTAPADAGVFTVGPDYLANAPASVGAGVSSTAALWVGPAAWPESGRFSAENLDAGFFTAFALRGRLVTVR